jgi:predicted aconitase with swiveling domain
MKEFKGRPILAGTLKGNALVSKQGFNTLASCIKSAMKNSKNVICSDQNNPDIFNQKLTGTILCLPKTIGSTTGGVVLQTIASMDAAPSAMLFSETIDSLAASGVILADVWNGKRIITIDRLGDEFLDIVSTGAMVEIKEDGTVYVFD